MPTLSMGETREDVDRKGAKMRRELGTVSNLNLSGKLTGHYGAKVDQCSCQENVVDWGCGLVDLQIPQIFVDFTCCE